MPKPGDVTKHTVLFIDDEPIRAQVLFDQGHEILLASTPELARMYLKNRSDIDVICLDHDMGEVSGYDIAEAYIIEKSIPVVIHSLNPDGADRIHHLLREYDVNHAIQPVTDVKSFISAVLIVGASAQ